VSNGMVFDLGGGSIQITRFANRRLVNTISLPFGALRLSQRFLESDPPSRKQLGRLRDHVRRGLEQAHIGRLAPADRLVGTGGTLRNLAKIDRQMRHYPVHRVHGYVLSLDHLSDVSERLAKTPEHRRDDIPGLSAERSDSIVGGAVAISTLAEFVRATDILVSGQGLREGVALGLFKLSIDEPTAVKEAALVSLESRFDGWRADAAARRRGVAAALQRLLQPSAPTSLASAVDDAARLLDIGRTLDVVNRHEHAADILLTTDLDGFSHQELALASAIARRAGDRHADVLSRLPVGHKIKEGQLDRAAIVLGLADEIEARCLPRRPISVQCDIGRNVTLSIGSLQSWLVKDLDKRFEHSFGRPLIVKQQN
jgi:exopolyphosphatase/guanosine-5'-triphosphate,3'-diphosphate pyrophosphatase